MRTATPLSTGRSVRLRSVDVATVEEGVITSHDFYLDQMEMLEQRGLTGQEAVSSA